MKKLLILSSIFSLALTGCSGDSTKTKSSNSSKPDESSIHTELKELVKTDKVYLRDTRAVSVKQGPVKSSDNIGSQSDNKSKTQKESYDAWKVIQKHEVFGRQDIYLSTSWMLTENQREGTSYIKWLGEKETSIFNKKKKVYFKGTTLSIMKRMELFSKVSDLDTSDLKDTGKNWRLERNTMMLGRHCQIHSLKFKNKTWKMWSTKLHGIDPKVYHDYEQWSRLPSLGGMPLKLVIYRGKGNSTLIFDTSKIEKITVTSDSLTIPPGSKRVNEVFQVTSGRTQQLMESFSEILGD